MMDELADLSRVHGTMLDIRGGKAYPGEDAEILFTLSGMTVFRVGRASAVFGLPRQTLLAFVKQAADFLRSRNHPTRLICTFQRKPN